MRSRGYYLLSTIAISICLGVYIHYSNRYEDFSAVSSFYAPIAPKYLIYSFGEFSIILFSILGLFGLTDIHKSYDLLGKYSSVYVSSTANASIVLGRAVSVMATIWIPLCIWIAVVQSSGVISSMLKLEVIQPFEWSSMAQFLVIDSLIFCACWSMMCLVITHVLRNAVVTAIAMLTLITLHLYTILFIPIRHLTSISISPMFGTPASEIIGIQIPNQVTFSRIAVVLFVIGLFFAVSGLPFRGNTNKTIARTRRLTFALCILGAITLGGSLFFDNSHDFHSFCFDEVEEYSGLKQTALFDVQSVVGDITIEPGKTLGYRLLYDIEVGLEHRIQELKFSLNPKLDIQELKINERPISYRRWGSLVLVESIQDYMTNGKIQLLIVVDGHPMTFYSVKHQIDWKEYSYMNSNIKSLGTENSLFEKRYVALLPNIAWLPHFTDARVSDTTYSLMGGDRFDAAFKVAIPANWKVVSVGKQNVVPSGSKHQTTVKLQMTDQVASMPLIAAQFTSYSDIMENIDFRIDTITNRDSIQNLSKDVYLHVKGNLIRLIHSLRDKGLEYPYGSFTLVEVPGALKGHNDGLVLESNRSFPGIFLISEHEFFNANFERGWEWMAAVGNDVSNARKSRTLTNYFDRSLRNESVLDGVSKAMFFYEICTKDEYARVLGLLLHNLVNKIIRHEMSLSALRSYSIHEYISKPGSLSIVGRETKIRDAIHSLLGGGNRDVYGDTWQVEHPKIWTVALERSGTDLVSNALDAPAYLALAKLIDSFLSVLLAKYEEEDLRLLIDRWLNQYRSECIDEDQVLSLGREAGIELGSLMEYFSQSQKPKFSVSEGLMRPVHDAKDEVRFNTSVAIHNESDVLGAGYFRIDLPIVGNAGVIWEEPFLSEVVVIPPRMSVEIGMNSDRSPMDAWFVPTVVSENRFATPVDLVSRTDDKEVLIEDTLVGFKQSKWVPSPREEIVVDDLSADVRVWSGTRFKSVVDIENCANLSRHRDFVPSKAWCRVDFERSFGAYRRTMLVAHHGNGEYLVEYPARIPSNGLWRLEFFVPKMDVSEAMRLRMPPVPPSLPKDGYVELSVKWNEESRSVKVNFAKASVGWNTLSDFQVPKGNVSVFVSNDAMGGSVVSDAIRWVPVTSGDSMESPDS